MISLLGLLDFFDFLIIGGECERAKPHLEPYLKALELLKASKDHTFIFEDFVSGIEAGMLVFGLSTRNPEHLLMEAEPNFLIKDYEDSKLWAALEELDKKPDKKACATLEDPRGKQKKHMEEYSPALSSEGGKASGKPRWHLLKDLEALVASLPACC